MPVTYYENSATISTTEWSLPRNAAYDSGQPQTDAGLVQIVLDAAAVAAGDQFLLRLYERARTADTQRVAEEWILVGPIGRPLVVTPGVLVARGWDVTLLRIAGSDRAIPWSVRRVS